MSTRLLALCLCPLVFAADKTCATITLEFPDLSVDRKGMVTTCELSLPPSYDVAKKYPLVVWLGGGEGGNKPARGFLPEDEFVTVGLPYPAGANNPTQANMVGDFSKIWAYHRTMLDAIRKAVPNLDPTVSILAGFSNGAHAMDGMLRTDASGTPLTSYFGLFIFADGGGTDYTTQGNLPSLAGKHAYLCWGEMSPNNKSVQKLAKELQAKGVEVIASEMKGVGHAFAESEQGRVKLWIEKTLATPDTIKK